MLWASSICCIFFHSREGQKLILKVTDHCFVIICFQCLGYKKKQKTKPNSKGGKKAVSNGSNNPSILLCQALLYSHPGRRRGFSLNVEAAAQPQCCHGAWRHKERTVMPRDSQKVAWASLGVCCPQTHARFCVTGIPCLPQEKKLMPFLD